MSKKVLIISSLTNTYNLQAKMLATVAFAICSLAGFADTVKIGDLTWRYSLNGNNATIDGLEPVPASASEVIVPSVITRDGVDYPVTVIGDQAFCGRKDITSITLPDTVECMNGIAFSWCHNLKRVMLPASLKRFSLGIFAGCGKLESIVVSKENPAYRSENGMMLTKNRKVLIFGVNGDVKIPDGVERIEIAAFACMVNLRSVKIPASVTTISVGAFRQCTSLEKVGINGNVRIGMDAFSACEHLSIIGFKQDAPTFNGSNQFKGVSQDCTVYIPRNNKTYEVIDGKWQGLKVNYFKK